MGKAAGLVVGVFVVGGAAMSFLSGVLGTFSEPVALSMMGVGLVMGSQLLGKTAPATAPQQHEDALKA